MSNEPVLKGVGIRDLQCGTGVTVVEPANLYECVLDDDVFVGPFVEIQKGVRIGARTRVQSHAFICELVTIGSDCFVSHGVMFVNDRLRSGGPAKGDRAIWESTQVGNHVSLGTGATILPVRIADHVVVGAGAVVTSDLLEPGVYVGNPARLLRPLDVGESS